ncbi:MAG TPA: TetR/AcrR family transcriptional regulator [Steroidobacteraceae bacterium]|nr:TetR/AcrR family transcriptional regulator [Steroidobacteraceae bacterium]
MPKAWKKTIEAHRRGVRDASLESTATLVSKHGLHSVTMSQIAEESGIGRATLYKYFSDIEQILVAWHERHVAGHVEHLAALRDQAGSVGMRLQSVLEAYALIANERHVDAELAALLHRGAHVVRAQQQLLDLLKGLMAEGAKSGELRDDIAPAELAIYCLHALTAAGTLPNKAAVHRLVELTITALRTPA